MTELSLVLLSVMPVLVIIAGLHDLITMKIPNWISGLLILGFFPAALALGLPLSVVGLSVGLAVAALFAGAQGGYSLWRGHRHRRPSGLSGRPSGQGFHRGLNLRLATYGALRGVLTERGHYR